MQGQGIVKLDIEGRERWLRIGTLSCAIFCEIENIGIADMQQRLQEQRPFTLIKFVFAAASAHCRLAKEEIDFTQDDISVWIDQMGSEEIMKIMAASMNTFEEKKSQTGKSPKKNQKTKR